ncbi:CPBP family intramembrane glutamic endopeptidase [uncultured Spirosoma sp.]|uniref:CPBP family intramembrane glutamic endopeptidase n=1 Tax=uncultured Spirosoma sp. TaxID=278208 RepID=UPI002583DD39|nr:CPBP family intramembrane glutamic endopeptidase [uncultured Spirosoma sp.]
MIKLRATLFFLGCTLLGMSLGSALALPIAYWAGDISRIDSMPQFIRQVAQLPNGWYIIIGVQAVSHLSSCLVPALIYWYHFETRRWPDFQNRPIGAVSGLWIGLLSVVAILPINELIIDWNQHLPLPALLGPVGEWMHRKEQESSLLTAQLVAFNSVHQLLIAVGVIGFVAAIGEEIFFRGVVQHKLMEWTTNVHLSIWLAAVLFSIAHVQFYGFFPRLILGALFGYLYYWSGNLWVAVIAHLINNSLIVITLYFQQQTVYRHTNFRVDITSWFWIVASLFAVLVLLIRFHRLNRNTSIKPS